MTELLMMVGIKVIPPNDLLAWDSSTQTVGRNKASKTNIRRFFCEKALPQKSGITVGHGQYRNAVATGQLGIHDIPRILSDPQYDPTLPRYGTDRVQVRPALGPNSLESIALRIFRVMHRVRSYRMSGKMSPRLRTTIFVLALMSTFLPSAIAQKARKGTPVLSVKGSNVVSEVSERARQLPSRGPAELAAFGNDLIARKGFDYKFDTCDILNRRVRTHSAPAETVHDYQMTLIDGRKLTVRFAIENPNESLCGECWSSIPSLQVTNKEIALIAEGKRYRVRRPPSFVLDEAHLVDESFKKVLRTWQLPYQGMPVGISADGSKLYLAFYPGNDLEHLVLEVSENGPPQFRERAVIKSSEGKSVENHPTEPTNAYLSFMSFRAGEKTYRIKFTAPCT